MGIRDSFKNKKRIVVKVGSSSLTHPETLRLDLIKMEILVRELSDLRNGGADVVLVTSGAIAVGRSALGFDYKPDEISEKQACAAVGQTRLIMIYQKLFAEYNQIAAQILLTKDNVLNPISRSNARNTFEELLKLHAIPVVNENDTVAVSEIEQLPNFGDNDTMSAVIASLINADLLILLSDIDGLYTD
ncbi:MAG: glutamate 5-kinase, partial [Eubacterium sp.]|nr:glutamate 5-kinase [Eubacterium sp.]